CGGEDRRHGRLSFSGNSAVLVEIVERKRFDGGQPVSNPVDDDVPAMDTLIAGKRTSAAASSASSSILWMCTTLSFIGVPPEVGRLANHCRPEQCSQRGYTDESNPCQLQRDGHSGRIRVPGRKSNHGSRCQADQRESDDGVEEDFLSHVGPRFSVRGSLSSMSEGGG